MRTDAKTTPIPSLLRDAVQQVEERIHAEIERTLARLPDGSRLLDDLEGIIEDVQDPRVYQQLRDLLTQLDAYTCEVRHAAAPDLVGDVLDPVRAIATDIKSGFL
jgi:hypothetical protein